MWFIFNYEQLDYKMGTVPGESLITLVSLIQLTKLGNSWHKKKPHHTRCNVGASKNATRHFLRCDYLYI